MTVRRRILLRCDAAAGETPGAIRCSELVSSSDRPSETAPSAFTHHVNVAALLESARFLYGRRPTAYLYTVGGENFEFSLLTTDEHG